MGIIVFKIVNRIDEYIGVRFNHTRNKRIFKVTARRLVVFNARITLPPMVVTGILFNRYSSYSAYSSYNGITTQDHTLKQYVLTTYILVHYIILLLYNIRYFCESFWSKLEYSSMTITVRNIFYTCRS